jgi:hypothetical protein
MTGEIQYHTPAMAGEWYYLVSTPLQDVQYEGAKRAAQAALLALPLFFILMYYLLF